MYKYDFGISFAGEDREQAQKLADLLKAEHVTIFYDKDEESQLWGQDLYQKFQQIYGIECRFFIPFISHNYLQKRWPRHELRQAQARDFKSDIEYILPLRLDDTALPGLNDTTGYVDLRQKSIEDVAQLCLKKIADHSSLRQLYVFLRKNNPRIFNIFVNKPRHVALRSSLSHATELLGILNEIESQICSGSDSHSTICNGGVGPDGVIPSNAPEPHTIVNLHLTDEFYTRMPV